MLVESIPLAHSSLLDKSAVVSSFRLGVGCDARTLTKRKRERPGKKSKRSLQESCFCLMHHLAMMSMMMGTRDCWSKCGIKRLVGTCLPQLITKFHLECANDIVLENHPEPTRFSIFHHRQPRLVVRQYYWLALIWVTNFELISDHCLDSFLPIYFYAISIIPCMAEDDVRNMFLTGLARFFTISPYL